MIMLRFNVCSKTDEIQLSLIHDNKIKSQIKTETKHRKRSEEKKQSHRGVREISLPVRHMYCHTHSWAVLAHFLTGSVHTSHK